jgi:hypothetical protein
VVAARFERDDECAAAGALAGCFECEDLRVRATVLLVPPIARELPGRVEHDRADHRVRLHGPAAFFRQRKCVPHPEFKIVHGGNLKERETFWDFVRTY